MRALALAGTAVLSVIGLAAATPLWATAACGVGVLALVPALETAHRRETPTRRRARIYRYRLVYAERYGRGPERLTECKEHL